MRVIFCLILLFSFTCFSKDSFSWTGLKKEKIDLAYPLLTIRGAKGFLACAYINTDICDKTKEACAIVSGVKTHEDMLEKKVISVSTLAKDLGIKVGMTGRQVLNLLK